ncbi:MAG: alpha/beta hydrolase family protein [Woeseiaceae bacterium]
MNRLTLAVGAWLALSLTHIAIANPISVQDLYAPVEDRQFSISPDGLTIVNTAALSTENAIRFTDTEFTEVRTTTPTGDLAPRNIQWVDRKVVSFEAKGRIFFARIDGNTWGQVLSNLYVEDGKLSSIGELKRSLRSWRVAHTLPDNPDEIIVTGFNARGYSSVYSLDLETLQPTEIISGKKLKADAWLIDRNGETQMAIREDKGAVKFYIRNDQEKWVEHDELHADKSFKLNYDGTSYLDRRAIVLEYGYGGDQLLVAENLTTGRFRLVQYDPNQGEITRVLVDDERYDVVASAFHQPTLLWDDESSTLVGVHYVQTQFQTVWLDETFADYQMTLANKFPDEKVTIVDWSDDQSTMIFHVGRGNTAGRTMIYRRDDDAIELHTEHTPTLDNAELPIPSVVQYTARDGHEIEAYLTLPADGPTEGLPLIVRPHGGPWVRSVGALDRDSLYFASHGYAVLDMNFRGSTGYGRDHLLAGFDQFASLMIDDIADGARWATDSGLADPEQVFIMGWSYGGYASLMSAIRYPELYKGVVAGAAPIDIGMQIKNYKKEKAHLAYELWRTVLGDPKRDKEAQQAISPLYQLESLQAPTLVFHGDDDQVVSVEHAEAFEKRMKKLKRSPMVKIMRGEGHGFQYIANRVYYLENALAHFESQRTR